MRRPLIWFVVASAVTWLAVLLVAGSALALSTGDGGWLWQNPLPQGNNLEAVDAIDAQHAVAAGDSGTILTTTDGGTSWSAHDLGIAAAHIADLSFVDADNGWAAVWVQTRNGGDNPTLIAHTSNGGVTWAREGVNLPATAVDFVDASHGWSCGGNTVCSTGNGGRTWSAHRLGRGWYLNDVVFTDPSHGWVVGYREINCGSTDYPIILATSNGGATWHKQYFPSGYPDGQILNAVSFVDADHGWAVGSGSSEDGASTVLATTNGGATWQEQTSGTTADLLSATFVDASHGWLSSRDSVLATTDGGADWTAHDAGISVTAVSFADTLHGYAVGPSGALATTTDGGASWQVHSNSTPREGLPLLFSITFTDLDHGWAVGDGIILATSDGGASWSAQTAGSGLHSVCFLDASDGWAVGGGRPSVGYSFGGARVILHTRDGGLSWQTQFTRPETSGGSFTDVDFIDAGHGWAAGATTRGRPCVARTTDGGASWKFVALAQRGGAVTAVSFVDDSRGWATVREIGPHAHYMICATTNGGLTWRRQHAGVWNDITFVNARHGWAVGGSGSPRGACLVLTTRNGGRTWSRQYLSSPYDTAGMRVMFVDRLHGWIVCGAIIYATVDGGRHWRAERAGSEVGAVVFTDPSHGWAVAETADWTGGGGGILTTGTGGLAQ